MPTPLLALAPVFALALAAAPKDPPSGGCHGRVTGAVSARFTCLADVTTSEAGKPVFTVTPRDEIADVPVYKPGAFELPGAPAVRTYTLEDLGMGMASLAVEGGALFTATKTSNRRGEVTLTLRSVERDPHRPGVWIVHGQYRARLVPVSAGRKGEAVFEVSF